MASAVADQSELRRRKLAQEKEDEAKRKEVSERPEDDEEIDETTREYIEYFRSKFGENPRSDFLGIDGWQLFCLIYIVVAGVVLSILYFSVYARNRTTFSNVKLPMGMPGSGGGAMGLK